MQMLLLVVVLSSAWAVGCSAQEMRIPKLIHRNYMAGAAALQAATAGPQPDFKAHWLASCMTHHPGWQEVIWDEAAVLQLIQQDFPWFLPTYLSYPRLVQRSDVMRYMVLYKYGGVYLDADIECFTSMEASLQGRQLVLSCEDPGAWGQLHNAAMASTPGHPFWLAVLQEVMRRSPAASAAHGSWPLRQLRQLWRKSPFHDRITDVLQTTGPMMLTDVYQSYTGGAPACGHSLVVNGRVSTAYPVGSWFTPCLCGDDSCARYWTTQHFNLVELQQQGERVRVVSQWLQDKIKHQHQKQRRQRRQYQLLQQQREQSGQQLKAISIQELPPQQQHVVGIHHYSGSWTGWDQSHRTRYQQQMREEMSQHVLNFFQHSISFVHHHNNSCSAEGSRSSGSPAHNPAGLPTSTSLPCGQPEQLLAPGACRMLTVLGAATPAANSKSGSPLQMQQHPTVSLGCNNTLSSDVEGTCSRASTVQLSHTIHPSYVGEGSAMNSSSSSCNTEDCSLQADTGASDTSEHVPEVLPLDLHTEQHYQRLGCDVTLVTPQPWAASPAESSNTSHLPSAPRTAVQDSGSSCSNSGRPGSVQYIYGQLLPVDGDRSAAVPTWTLQDLLPHSQGDARYVLRFSCHGCEAPVLQQLFALPWSNSSVLDQVDLIHIDITYAAAEAASQQLSSNNNQEISTGHTTRGVQDSESPSSTAAAIPGLDEVFILLHQQLGFRGLWRQQLGSSTLRLGWVRQHVPAHTKMQPPDSQHAAAALKAAAAGTAPAVFVQVACNCCEQCCSSPAGSSRSGWLLQSSCPLWQRVACQLMGSPWAARTCSGVQAAPHSMSISLGGNATRPSTDVGSCAGKASCGPYACADCCGCTKSLWGVLQSWMQNTWSKDDSSVAYTAGPASSSIVPILTSCAMCAATGVLLLWAHRSAQAKRYAQAKQALLQG